MPTPNERKGLLFLALVALSGTGIRVWRSRLPPPAPSEAAALSGHLAKVDSARAARRVPKEKRARAARPVVVDSQPVDLNSATAGRIEALPGIGPALAKRIVQHRDSTGGFNGMTQLCDVRGIGPALAERLRPLVTFGGRSSPVSEACEPPSTEAGKGRLDRRRKGS